MNSMTSFIALMVVLALGFFCASCSCGDDDDNDNDDAADDDASDDDVDDDASDDDADDDSSDDDDDSSDDDDDDTGTELFSINFDDYSLGDLPSPWTVDAPGAGYFSVIADPTGKLEGKVLRMDGDPADSAFSEAYYPIAATLNKVEISFDLFNLGGSAFIFSLFGSTDWLTDIFRDPMTFEFTAYSATKSGMVVCGIVNDEVWYTVTVQIDLVGWQYSILLNGEETPCTGLGLYEPASQSLASFNIVDGMQEGYGGVVYYDNIVGVEY